MKRYIRSDSTGSLINKLNGLPVYNGYSKIPSYKEINMYKDVLNEFPIGTVIGKDWDAGDCYYRKKSDNKWETLDSPHYDLHSVSDYDIAENLAGRGAWCKKPLWLDTEETFNSVLSKEKETSGSLDSDFWGKSDKRNFGQFPNKKDFYGF